MLSPFDDSDALQIYVEEVVNICVPNMTRTSFGMRASCPVCGDGATHRKKRLQFYRETFSAYCFNSGCKLNEGGASGLGLTSILKGIPYSTESSEYLKWYQKNVRKAQKIVAQKIEELEPPTDGSVSLERKEDQQKTMFEDSWVEMPPSVREYCQSRKMFEAPFAPKEWKLYFCNRSKRLVIPWMEDGEIVYYQKRALLKGDDPKYIYPSGTSRPIFNADCVDASFPYIFCTEGSIDCCFLKNGVACGGLTPSIDQREELRDRFPGFKIVITTDNQWVDKSAKIALGGDWRSGSTGLLVSGMYDYLFFVWPKGEPAKDINEAVCRGSDCHFENEDWLKSHVYDALQTKFLFSL